MKTKKNAVISGSGDSTDNSVVSRKIKNVNDNLLPGLLSQMDLEKYSVKGLVSDLRQMELLLIARDTHNVKSLSKLLNPEYHKIFTTSSKMLRKIQSRLSALLSDIIGWNEEREVLPERSIIELLMSKERPFAVCICPLTVLGVQGKSLDYFVVTDQSTAQEINQEYDRDLYRHDLCTFDLTPIDLQVFEKAKLLFEKQSLGCDGEVFEFKDFKRVINGYHPVKRKKKSNEILLDTAAKRNQKTATTKRRNNKPGEKAGKDKTVSKRSVLKEADSTLKNAKKSALRIVKKTSNTKNNTTGIKSQTKVQRSNMKIVKKKSDVDLEDHSAEKKEFLLVDKPPTYVRSSNPIIVKRQSRPDQTD